jgi:Arc/MetJ-type ribon-helix-helix transcriptional regulator
LERIADASTATKTFVAPLTRTGNTSRRFDTYFRSRNNEAMKIALTKDVEDFLEEQVLARVCADASELANDVLHSVREQQRGPFEVTPELEAWLLEAADKSISPLTATDFDGIRRRVRARTQPPKT